MVINKQEQVQLLKDVSCVLKRVELVLNSLVEGQEQSENISTDRGFLRFDTNTVSKIEFVFVAEQPEPEDKYWSSLL